MGKLFFAFILMASTLPAADLSGFWLGSTTVGRRNQVVDFAFRFEQKGPALNGKVYLDYGATPIRKGAIEGDKFSFQIVAREQNGNEISETIFKFTGVMKDAEVELTRERQEIRNAGNAGTGFSRNGTLTFTIKRLP